MTGPVVPLVVTLFQFTPPRGGDAVDVVAGGRNADISIHAPAWRATPRHVHGNLPA